MEIQDSIILNKNKNSEGKPMDFKKQDAVSSTDIINTRNSTCTDEQISLDISNELYTVSVANIDNTIFNQDLEDTVVESTENSTSPATISPEICNNSLLTSDKFMHNKKEESASDMKFKRDSIEKVTDLHTTKPIIPERNRSETSAESLLIIDSLRVLSDTIEETQTLNDPNDADKTLEDLDMTLIVDDDENKTTKVNDTSIISQNKSKYNKINLNICTDEIPYPLKRKSSDDLLQNVKIQKTAILRDANQNSQNCDPENSNHNETTAENYTRMIFDPDETADNSDPKWNVLKELKTNEDYFNTVRQQWKSIALVNPHTDLTKRYLPYNSKEKQDAPKLSDSRSTTCSDYINKNITAKNSEIHKLKKELHYRRLSLRRRDEIINKIYENEQIVREMEKNREEVKNINMFYHDTVGAWNAYYLTKTEVEELKQQEKVLNFYETYYK